MVFGERTVTRISRLIARLERFPPTVLQLIMRLSVGAVFWNAGLAKVSTWHATLTLFRDVYRVPLLRPELAATLSTAIELICPALLVLGLAARFATLPIAGQILVIEVFVYPDDWVEHLTWTSLLLFILTRGPGPISVDHWITRFVQWKVGINPAHAADGSRR